MLNKNKLKSITNPPDRGTASFDAKDLCGKPLLSSKNFFFFNKKFKKTNSKVDNNIIEANCIKKYYKFIFSFFKIMSRPLFKLILGLQLSFLILS